MARPRNKGGRPRGPDTRIVSVRMFEDRARLLDAHVLQTGDTRNGLLNRLVERELREAGLLGAQR